MSIGYMIEWLAVFAASFIAMVIPPMPLPPAGDRYLCRKYGTPLWNQSDISQQLDELVALSLPASESEG